MRYKTRKKRHVKTCVKWRKYKNGKNLQFSAGHDLAHYANCCIWHARRNARISQAPSKCSTRPTLWAPRRGTGRQSCPVDSFHAPPTKLQQRVEEKYEKRREM